MLVLDNVNHTIYEHIDYCMKHSSSRLLVYYVFQIMKQLFLLSSRLTDTISDKMKEVFSKDPNEVRILFSSNATDGKYEPWVVVPYVQREYEKLIEYWYQVDHVDLRSYLSKTDELQDFLRTYDALYFTWGMYYVLNNLLYTLWFHTFYADLLEQWLIHIWFSAGAMVCSVDMWYYRYFDDAKNKNNMVMQWLWLFSHYICPHYSNKQKYTHIYEKTVKRHQHDDVLFIPLENHQAIYVKWDDRTLI